MDSETAADGSNNDTGLIKNFRHKLKTIYLKTIRLYTFYTPIAKGKHRVYLEALKLVKDLPQNIEVATRDGRRFCVNMATGMQTTVFFHGEYEKVLTEIVKTLLREGDNCLDVGANFGWYTTIFQKYCGTQAEIHAFEPVPPTFQELERNFRLMGSPKNVSINNLALGDQKDELTINLFEGLSTGHASLSNQGRSDCISYKCEVKTLDSYLAEQQAKDVNFVKVDIEGAEMMFLKGAEKLFKQKVPPIWLMEMARQQTGNFGYLPNDLLVFMTERAAYDFFRVDEERNKLIRIEKFEPDDIGANVICIPQGFYGDRVTALKNYFE
jgi:FkbM family methyltransferase